MLPSWCRTSATVRRAPFATVNGRRERDWRNAVEHVVEGCSLQMESTSTGWGDARHAVESRRVLYAPPGSSFEDGDRVDIGEMKFAVDGIPTFWESPFGGASHVEVHLIEWRG